ncbi:ANTAR domain-containing protein [Clavibacter lycopersici]|uniref:ANTAR domain-containing protein n=1 Tax=Clavibacter lycopersici TaxID=2301718 RepID=A0A399T801_9MICO|nr:ANTAR domain-containing protein [Clavibacter lycopersici]RIJ51154.1 ANTAR domain-containing protein [Clavibacter lycopersici]RIJ61219.1 ANTAR domain-containing protein [Clavibacter lycopersici]
MDQHRSELPADVVAAFHAARDRTACLGLLLTALLGSTSATGAAVVLPRAAGVVFAGDSGPVLGALLETPDPADADDVLRIPLADGSDPRRHPAGAVALHRATGPLDAHDRAVAAEIAVHARVALAAWDATDDLERGMESRTLIGQAQGILMERFSLDADRAFQVLRRHSQDGNVKLVEVARLVVQTGALPKV